MKKIEYNKLENISGGIDKCVLWALVWMAPAFTFSALLDPGPVGTNIRTCMSE
ncbi:MAG: hypothetical protein HC854_14655 [Flavobacterium sp.]|nr:hypothetical protein [Flavobacterium sp.]